MKLLSAKAFNLLNPFPNNPWFLMALVKQAFENIEGKGENAGNRHFLHFPKMFSTLPKTKINLLETSILSSANALNLDRSKNFAV